MTQHPEDTNLDPLQRPDVCAGWPTHTLPDWEAIARDLGEEWTAEETRIMEKAGMALRPVLMHLLGERFSSRGGRSVALRTVALGYLLFPGYFGGAAVEAKVAKRLKVTREAFSRAVAAAAATFSIRHQGARYHRPPHCKVTDPT